MKNIFIYKTPIGPLGMVDDNDFITEIFFYSKKLFQEKYKKRNFTEAETPLLGKAYKQLNEYFGGKRKIFDLPLLPKGTDFQRSVWNALLTIPYGETRSYVDIAVQIGNPKAYRAVGMANNRNPIVIIIPCHRVIGKDKSLTGYGGGLEAKKFLLDLENAL